MMVKTIVDFTLIVHFRHPNELGGMYWGANVVMNQLFCLASVYLYKEQLNDIISNNINYRHGSEVDAKVSPRCNPADFDSYNKKYVCEESRFEASLWNVVICLFVLSMFSFGGFLLSINRKYWVTFFDTRTGKQYRVDVYHEVVSDESKFEIFGVHPSYYDSIAEELMKWLTDNWDGWEGEKPDWFTAAAISNIPEDMLPMKFKLKLGGSKDERRKSLKKMVVEEAVVANKNSIMVNVNQVVPEG